MFPNTKVGSAMKKQQGSMLVVALFIIIVISLLAASLSRILSSSADGIANEVYSAKAVYAAESGMELAMYKVLSLPLVLNACPTQSDLQLQVNTYTGLENCTVAINCTSIKLEDASGTYLYYLTSLGTCDGGKIVAKHEVEAEVKL